jgi:hypothetical protein
MSEKRPGDSPQKTLPDPAGEAPPGPGESGRTAGERAGELRVERLTKDDGRSLIAYWSERPPR